MMCKARAYVGKSEIAMNLRMNGHRSDAKKIDKLAVDTHFLEPGHNFNRDAKFTIIEQITKTDLWYSPHEPASTKRRLLDEKTWNHRASRIQHGT